MEHFGWNVGTALLVWWVTGVCGAIAAVGKPREPLSRVAVLIDVIWLTVIGLAFVGMLPW